MRSSSSVFESSVKKRMSSLNLKRACSTNANGSPSSSRANSYWLMTMRMRWRRKKRSCWLGSTAGMSAPLADRVDDGAAHGLVQVDLEHRHDARQHQVVANGEQQLDDSPLVEVGAQTLEQLFRYTR